MSVITIKLLISADKIVSISERATYHYKLEKLRLAQNVRGPCTVDDCMCNKNTAGSKLANHIHMQIIYICASTSHLHWSYTV